jgi:Na+/H+ antiporter NhaA
LGKRKAILIGFYFLKTHTFSRIIENFEEIEQHIVKLSVVTEEIQKILHFALNDSILRIFWRIGGGRKRSFLPPPILSLNKRQIPVIQNVTN